MLLSAATTIGEALFLPGGRSRRRTAVAAIVDAMLLPRRVLKRRALEEQSAESELRLCRNMLPFCNGEGVRLLHDGGFSVAGQA